MKIIFRTHLDLLPIEKWPEELPAIPRIGDRIESGYLWNYFPSEEERAKGGIPPCQTRLILQVYSIEWKYYSSDTLLYLGSSTKEGMWYPVVELNIPSYFENMRSFYEWYGKITGKGKHYFI